MEIHLCTMPLPVQPVNLDGKYREFFLNTAEMMQTRKGENLETFSAVVQKRPLELQVLHLRKGRNCIPLETVWDIWEWTCS